MPGRAWYSDAGTAMSYFELSAKHGKAIPSPMMEVSYACGILKFGQIWGNPGAFFGKGS